MADRYAVAAGNWNDTATWSALDGGSPGASFPLLGDDVHLSALSGAIAVTINVASACRSIDCTGFTGSLVRSATLNIGTSTVPVNNIALKFVNTMTTSGSGLIQFVHTNASGVQTVTWAGLQVAAITFSHSNATGGCVLQDTQNGTGTLTITKGIINFNAQTVSCGTFNFTGAISRTATLTNCTVNCTTWTVSGSSFTLTLTGSTINCVGNFTTTGAQSYNVLNLTGVSGKATATFPASTTTTITTFSAAGSHTTPLSLVSSSSGTAATLAVTTATVNFVAIKDITSTFSTFGSINVSGNTGITFSYNSGSTFQSLNDAAYLSLRLHYPSQSTFSLQDLIHKFQVDNNVWGIDSWVTLFGGSGAFNDRAMSYWRTHA